VIFSALLTNIAFIPTLSAEPIKTQPVTPLEIYDIAINNDPTLSAAISAHSVSREEVEQISGALQPEVNFTADIARNREDVETDGVGTSGLTYFDSNKVQLKYVGTSGQPTAVAALLQEGKKAVNTLQKAYDTQERLIPIYRF